MSDKKYFIYARKSTDDKDHQIRSLPDQLAELHELARKEKIDVVDTFIEKQTAKEPETCFLKEEVFLLILKLL